GSIPAFAPGWTPTAPGTSHLNGCSPRSHRRLERDQGPHHAGAEAPGGERRPSAADRGHEIGALVIERLARRPPPADEVAVAHQQLELAIRIGDRLAGRDAAFEHPDALDV